jgi:hypothetical protein
MGLDAAFNGETWLRQQASIIDDLFERAAVELQANGIRLLAGSAPPKPEDLESTKKITLLPLRFSISNGEESLSLSLLATTRKGPPRYAVKLEVLGVLTREALQRLAIEYADIWDKAYLKTGLWIDEGANAQPLNDLSQITRITSSRLNIAGAFLRADLGLTIQQGVMTMGLLYRSVLDELSGAGKMSRLYAQLNNCLGNRTPSFQRIIRP